nr:DUF6701 domain-containing protein [Vibrio natriegens]
MISFSSFAANCVFWGNKDFTVTYDVIGPADNSYVLLEHNGKHPNEVLWYTTKNLGDVNYYFYESNLLSGQPYNIRIEHSVRSATLKYFRKFAGESNWQLIKTKYNVDLKNGQLSLVHFGSPSDVNCGDTFPKPVEPELPDNLCHYFPEPIQGIKGSLENKLVVTNASARALGWSEDYRGTYTVTDKHDLFRYSTSMREPKQSKFVLAGFDTVNQADAQDRLYMEPICATDAGCDVGNKDGHLESRKANEPIDVPTNFGSRTLKITAENIKQVCINNELCRSNKYIVDGKSGIEIQVTSNLDTLDISQYSSPFGQVKVIIPNATNIRSLKMEVGSQDDVRLVIPQNAEVTFGQWSHTGRGKYSFFNGSKINVSGDSVVYNSPISITTDYYVTVYAPNANITFNTSNSDFYGFILANRISFENPITIHGSVTAQHLIMKKDVVIQKPDYSCPLPPVGDVETFIVEPQWKYGLTCERIPVDFKLVNEQNNLIDSDASFHPLVSPNNGVSWCSGETGDNCGIGVTNLVNGEKTLYLSVQDVGEFTVGAYYDYESYSGGLVEFVPYKLHATPSIIDMVAGKDAAVSIQALSCYGDQTTVVKNYHSSLAMSSDNYELEKPSTGSLYDFNVSDLQFTNGYADATVSWQDVGQTKVVFEDANFDCRDYEQEGENLACPIDGGVLKGEFTVKSRPWKIAACNIVAKNDGKTNPATQATGNGFIAAAESFNVTYKPIVHSDSRGNATNVCEYPLTQNYFSDSNTAAPLDAEFSVLYPSGGDIANLDPSKGSNLDFSSVEAKTVEYVWDEVGSLNLKTKATYLGMELDEYDVTVGRFYPKYFKVVDSSWAYPDELSFVYMNQPFDGVEFSVEALNANKAAIKNYADFSTKAEFNLDDIEHYSGRFDAPNFGAGSWSNQSDKSIGEFSISNSGQCIGSACWNKDLGGNYPDGPFNSVVGTDTSEIGLVYTENADPVEYIIDDDKSTNSRLVVQPDIRFGRADLDDVGGRQGDTLHVPLRVEYWNGSRFVVNSNDSQTDINGIKWDQVHIWPTGEGAAPKDVTLGSGGEVSSGSSRSITAKQAESYRQQTRVWLDLEANDLPWLKYNWDKDLAGEENPSSVVTFGIHRGNDRVIYRGEPGLTAQ